jgi:hypothetical protein
MSRRRELAVFISLRKLCTSIEIFNLQLIIQVIFKAILSWKLTSATYMLMIKGTQ